MLQQIGEGWKPTAAALIEYAGMYYSDDLGAVWYIDAADGAISLRRPNDQRRGLEPVNPDVLRGDLGTTDEPFYFGMRFERSADGRITGFFITAKPDPYEIARDVRFERVTQQSARPTVQDKLR